MEKDRMELRDKLLKDLQQAMRDKDAQRRSTLRLVRAAVANAEIETGRPLSDEEVLEIINREASRRREAIQEYGQAGRQDLVEQEQAELSIIEGYLPRQLSQEEIEAAAREAIAELGVGSPSQMGEVMRYLMPQLKGRADGRLVNQMVRELLSEDQ
jgi:uncharacterized protein YqeY